MDQPSPIKNQARSYFKAYIGILAFIGVFALGVFAGRHNYLAPGNGHAAGDSSTTSSTGVFEKAASADAQIDFQQYWDVWDIVKQDAYKADVKDSDLFYNSLQGMVTALGDPYSVYFPPAAADQFNSTLSGELEGIGAEVGVKNDQLVVIAPVPNSPAERAGLHPGDKILAIDKESTSGLDVNTAVTKIRGAAGTKVVLTVVPSDASPSTKSHDVTIAREKIIVPSLTYSLKNSNIAYLKLNEFNADSARLLDQAVATMPTNLKGVILDLRGNPGGMLDTAVQIASKWVSPGNLVVEERGRLAEFQKKFNAQGLQSFKGVKTIVLINEGSASASEIVAGALQDYKLATVLGEQSFGKGSVQNLYNFPDGSALKLTIAEWYTPLGRNINKAGITPDVVFKQDWTSEKIGEDKMLDKAIGLLK